MDSAHLKFCLPVPAAGIDVARKAVILARECGLTISLEDVTIDSLVPSSLQSDSKEGFMHALPNHPVRPNL